LYVARNLRRHPLRTLSALLSVGVVVGLAFVAISLERGVRRQFDEFFRRGDVHAVVVPAGARDPLFSHLPETLAPALRDVPNTAAVYPFAWALVDVPGGVPLLLSGVLPGSPLLDDLELVEGHTLLDPESPVRAGALDRVLYGREAAEGYEVSVGDGVWIGEEQFFVVGIYDDSIGFLRSGAIALLPSVQQVGGLEGKVSSIGVGLGVVGPGQVNDAVEAIETALPGVAVVRPGAFTRAFRFFRFGGVAIELVTALALLLGASLLSSTLLKTVFERRRELAALRTLGFGRLRLARGVLAESLLLAILAGLVGCVLGTVALELMGGERSRSWIVGTYELELWLRVAVLSLGMGAVGAISPMLRASKVAPGQVSPWR
jgi:ABC-type lipoprotein release transport system permease subunit